MWFREFLKRILTIRGSISKRGRILIGIGTIIFIFALWSLVAYWHILFPTGDGGPILEVTILPPPHSVVKAFVTLTQDYDKDLIRSTFYSFRRILLGFLLAAIVAIPIGILMGAFPFFYSVFNPFFSPMRYMPIAAFAPLFLAWFGLGDTMKVMLLFLGTVVFMVPIVVESVQAIKEELLQTAYTLGANQWQVLMTVLVPAAMPNIFEGLRVMNAIGWTYIILAEMVNPGKGLGYMILVSGRYSRTNEIFAGIVVIGIIGILSDMGLRAMNRKFFGWKEGL